MPKSDFKTDLSNYATVAERIGLFYERFPEGRIMTDLVEHTSTEVVFRSRVYRGQTDKRPAATGWAAEREGDGDINIVACLENTETSAIGRALANLGFTASSNRPSREEMDRANRKRAALNVRNAGATSTPQPSRVLRIDSLEVLALARKHGLSPVKVEVLRRTIRDSRVAVTRIERIELRLRSWVIARKGRLVSQGH